MDQIAIDEFTPEIREQIKTRLGVSKLEDLGGFESFIFRVPRGQRKLILRATHTIHRSLDEIEGELEWIQFLKERGASVCGVELIEGDNRCLSIGPYTLSLLEEVKGRTIEEADWTPELFESWGRQIGLFHQLATGFEPSRSSRKRFEWDEDENQNFADRIPSDQGLILEICNEAMNKLRALPRSADLYGLIHGDAHPGNFYFDEGKPIFFDFDDCGYQWFAYDVATVLFSAIYQPWIPDDRIRHQKEAEKFLPAFLKGYEREFPVPEFVLENMPLFLKLRELSLYAVINKFVDLDKMGSDSFGVKFIKGRRERIENGVPYLFDSFI